jgi:hypothetical protein
VPPTLLHHRAAVGPRIDVVAQKNGNERETRNVLDELHWCGRA